MQKKKNKFFRMVCFPPEIQFLLQNIFTTE